MTTRGLLRLETGADGTHILRPLDDTELDAVRAELRWLSGEPDCPPDLRALIATETEDREGFEQ